MTELLITGATGLLGREVCSEALKRGGFKGVEIVTRRDCNLLDYEQVWRLLMRTRPRKILHLAGKVGGVKSNSDRPSSFFVTNARMNLNVLECAQLMGIPNVISVLSTCVYPATRCVTWPLTEDQLHGGPPHGSNFGYAFAKRMLEVHSRAVRLEHGLNFSCVIPNNLYGVYDNFDLKDAHVVPAVIRRIYEAKNNIAPAPVFWGSGQPSREFTLARDLAKILLRLINDPNRPELVNIGNRAEVTIGDLVQRVAARFDYQGPILWDHSPEREGQHRKPSGSSYDPGFNWTDLDTGLGEVCGWFSQHYPKIRGIHQ